MSGPYRTAHAMGGDAEAAERAVIGACLLDPSAVDIVPLESRHFQHAAWRFAWEAISEMREERQAIDPVTVAAYLEARGRPAVDMAKLSDALIDTPTASNVEYYAEIVRQAWVTRQVLVAADEIKGANANGLSGEDLLSHALKVMSAIDSGAPGQASTIGEIVTGRIRELLDVLDAKERGEPAATGVLTGINGLDRLLGGLQPNVTLLAGRPGMGKSGAAQSITDAVTARDDGAHVFSLEDTRSAYADRGLSRRSGVPAESIRSVEFRAMEMQPLMGAANELRERRRWLVDDRSGLTAEEIVRSVRRHARENRTVLVVVDYIQLVKGPPGIWDKQQILDHAATTFSNAAKSDGIAYLVLSQLNRKCEDRDNKRPVVADLRGAGELEERAKCIIFLYRPAVYEANAPSDLIELIVAKNNHGRTGTITASWDGPTTRVS